MFLIPLIVPALFEVSCSKLLSNSFELPQIYHIPEMMIIIRPGTRRQRREGRGAVVVHKASRAHVMHQLLYQVH
jgi:hypothetical protein